MTISQSLKLAIARLSTRDINSPRLEAEILLANIIKKPREFLLTHGEKKLTARQVSSFKFQVSRRLQGQPLAYLTGDREFYGLNFKVNKNVLIPRPETELMVEEALKLTARNSSALAHRRRDRRLVTLIDVGTGSGCIIIALAKLLNQESPRRHGFGGRAEIRNQEFIGIDISAKALAVAKKNASTHHVDKKIKFLKGNLLEPLLKNDKLVIGHWSLVILANLPYLTPFQIKNSPSIKYEPKSALAGGSDGLKYYRQLFKQINKLRVMSRESRDISVLCEFDPRQTSIIKRLIKHELPQAKPRIKKDLSGLNRLVIITI